MIKLTFSPADIDAFNKERYHHPHPHVQRKMEVLWLKSQGLPHHEICRLTDLSADTVRRYLRAYQAGGVERLKTLPFYRQQSALADHRTTIEAEFRARPPASIKEAQARIETLTGIRRSENRVREYLKAIGIKRYKIGLIPAKAEVEEQAAFKKKRSNRD